MQLHSIGTPLSARSLKQHVLALPRHPTACLCIASIPLTRQASPTSISYSLPHRFTTYSSFVGYGFATPSDRGPQMYLKSSWPQQGNESSGQCRRCSWVLVRATHASPCTHGGLSGCVRRVISESLSEWAGFPGARLPRIGSPQASSHCRSRVGDSVFGLWCDCWNSLWP